MKIGIVSTWFERGAAIVSRQLSDALSAEGADVYIYARGERYALGDPKWDLPQVHWGRRLHWSGSGKIDRKDFESWIQSTGIEVLIFNEQRWWQPVVWAKVAGVKCGAYIDYYTKQTVPLFQLYDFLICNTERHYEAFKWHSGAHYVPWGTDVDLYSPVESERKEFVFFHSCGWDPHRKGTDIVVSAFNLIRSEHDAKLVIHTQADLGDLVKNDDRVTLIKGTVPAPGLYHLGDCYVYPSRLEGIGLTVCEASAAGLVVITSDEMPMSEFVINEQTGFLVPVSNRYMRDDGYFWPMNEVGAVELANVMRQVCTLPPNEFHNMQRAAREYSLKNRSWKENSKILLSYINNTPYCEPHGATIAAINSFDYAGWIGKLDHLIEVPLLRSMMASLFGIYRRLRQPHLYSNP